MPSQQLSSDDEESAEEDEDGRFVNCWTPVSDEMKKREILQTKHINFRRVYAVQRQDSRGSVLKCALHVNCEFLVRILLCGSNTLLCKKKLLNIGFITSVGVQVCDRRPSVRRVFWLTMHNKLSQD
jgi:hypothetical protein